MSIVEVAKLSGCSHATVSRVLNDRPGVANETASRVRDAMKRLGYTPSARRPGPAPKERQNVRAGQVMVLMFGTDSTPLLAPVTAAAIQAVEFALADQGFNMGLAHVRDDGRLPPLLARNGVDGLILHGYPPSGEVAERLARYPSVWLLSKRSEDGDWGDRVAPDNDAVGKLAGEYLLEQGHRRMGVLRLESTHLGFQQREEAFRRTVERAGASVSIVGPDRTLETSITSGRQGRALIDSVVQRLVSLDERPTALFVTRGRLTLMVYEALRRHGIEPGEDIKVIASDNDPMLRDLSPAPVMVDVRPDLIGRRAVKQLLLNISNRDEPARSTVLVEPRLIVPDAEGD